MVDELETFGGAVEDVRAFCAVADFGTVSAAARQLGETKGSISRRISRLERRLGVHLLARTPRAVTPTEEGLAFFARASEALAWLDDAAESARQSRQVPRGHLRVTAPVDMGMDVLPPLIAEFRRQQPQITVELLLTDTALDLAAHRVDLALRASADDLPDMGYRASVIAQFEIGLYAAPDYLAANGQPETPDSLAEHELLLAHPNASAAEKLRLSNARGQQCDIVVRPVVRTSDYASLLRLCIAGGGIGPIPALVAANAVSSGTLTRVLPQWHLAIGRLHAISVAGNDAPARVRVFRDFIREKLK